MVCENENIIVLFAKWAHRLARIAKIKEGQDTQDVYEHVVNESVGNALRMPFSMGDKDTLTFLFNSAGIRSVRTTTESEVVCFSSVREMVLSDVKGWFPFVGIDLDEDTIDAVTKEAEIALKAFQSSEGTVKFEVPVQIVVADLV